MQTPETSLIYTQRGLLNLFNIIRSLLGLLSTLLSSLG